MYSCKISQVPWIYCPSWVPLCVAAQAERMHRGLIEVGGSFEKFQILCRLATDPRMQKVWTELARCRRSDEYSKTNSRLHGADLTQPDFDELLRLFFREIVHHRWQGIQTVPEFEIDRIRRHYLEMAAQLKADVLRKVGRGYGNSAQRCACCDSAKNRSGNSRIYSRCCPDHAGVIQLASLWNCCYNL